MYKPVTISIDEDLLPKIDQFAKENGFTRSGLLAFCVDQYIKAKTIEPELKIALENMASSFEALSKKYEEINAKN